jgi:hypothetical protein
MTLFRLIACVTLATAAIATSYAEAECPLNTASVTPRFGHGTQIVIPVRINQSGPYDFLLDTGTEITMVDPTLAAESKLEIKGKIGVTAVIDNAVASIGVADSLEVGSLKTEHPLVVVKALGQVAAADARIRGILGINFLGHFDLLIDYAHKMVCMGVANQMQDSLAGERLPLLAPEHPASDIPFTHPLLIAARVAGNGKRQTVLRLDSGSNRALLYAANSDTPSWLLKPSLHGRTASGTQQTLALLPPGDVRIGSGALRQVSFVAPINPTKNATQKEEDGLLPTSLFSRIYINYVSRFVILNPVADLDSKK